MPTARYFIVRDHDLWLIRYGDAEYGPYRSQNEALVFAIDAARKLNSHGETAEVCVMGQNGHFRPEWISGHNAHSAAP